MTKEKPSKEFLAISRRVGRAVKDFGMISDGDKIIAGVSGGKDSLSLLKLLCYRRKIAPVDFDLTAVHIDYGMNHVDLDALEALCKKWNVALRVEQIDILKGKKWEDINCFWCAWNRRKALFKLARQMKCNKIALGHHMDDIVETILMNMCFRAEIGAMKPRQELFNGEVTIIRPLAYEREIRLSELAKQEKFKNLDIYNCPHNDTSMRKMIKSMVASLEKKKPSVSINIFKSLGNIKQDYLID